MIRELRTIETVMEPQHSWACSKCHTDMSTDFYRTRSAARARAMRHVERTGHRVTLTKQLDSVIEPIAQEGDPR